VCKEVECRLRSRALDFLEKRPPLREYFHRSAVVRVHICDAFRTGVVLVEPFLDRSAIFRVGSTVSKVEVGKPCDERSLQKLDMPDGRFQLV
jgi:hypothetical protein